MNRHSVITWVAAVAVSLLPVFAQSSTTLTLEQAMATAAKNHPRVAAALLDALAANQVTIQQRSALYPTLYGSISGAGALDQSRLAAGSLNNPIIYNRMASGFTVSQLITDFGRTGSLTESARLKAQAEEDNAQATRAQVLLQVAQAYFAALRTSRVLTVASQTVDARQLIVDQVTALANSKLKSGLDVSFASVNLSEAKLFLVSAQNEMEAAFAQLSEAMGYSSRQNFKLSEEPLPEQMPEDPKSLIQQAYASRPELASLRAEQGAAVKFAEAEKRLWLPSISALASAGAVPGHEDGIRGRYGALGLNVNIPIFNGHLFSARRSEAEFRSQAAEQNLKEMQIRIARDVQVSWLNAKTAYERLSITRQLLDQASQALELAQSRYNLGLSSIVELSQAQLNETSAEIAGATARYDYQLQRAVLDYQTGALR